MVSRGWIGLVCITIVGCAPHAVVAGQGTAEDELLAEADDPSLLGDEDAIDDAPLADEPAPPSIPDERCTKAPTKTKAQPVDPSAPAAAALLTTAGGKLVGLPLRETDFFTTVTGTIAETTVTQTFVNPYDKPIEAVYTFPLPHDGAVDDYSFRFAGREVRGVIKRREEARAEYEDAKRAGRTAGLLEQERPNVFTQSLANLPAGAKIEVEIHVVQPLAPEKGRYELALPTVVAPRFVPGKPTGRAGTGMLDDTDRVPDASRISPPVLPAGLRTCGDLNITVAFAPGLPVGSIRSEAHRIEIERGTAGTFVELDEQYALLNRDFVLSWQRSGSRPRAMMLTDEVDGERFFTLTIEPPASVAVDDAPARELIFVLDASGSMSGEPIDVAKATMRRFLRGMRPGDAFQVVRFSDSASGLGDTLVPATDANVARAIAYVDALEGEGGTMMTEGIRAALDFPHDEERVRFVVFLTDGFIGNEADIFALIDERIGDARLFSLGVGSSVNRYLLDGMARVGRGEVAYVNLGEPADPIVDRLYAQLDRPALTDIVVDFGDTDVAAVVPARVPDLMVDRPVTLFGRLDGEPTGEIVVRGRRGGEATVLRVPVRAVEQQRATGLASSWARKRIDELMFDPDYLRERAPKAGRIRSSVVDLSLKYGVLTEFTAFVAVDTRGKVDGRAADTTVVQGVDLAEGVAEQSVWGQMVGTEIGESYGAGGLGLIGSGGGGGSGSGYGRGSGAGFGGRGTRVPQVRFAKAQVKGAIDRHIIRRIVRAHIGEMRGCYNAELVRDPQAKGRVVVKFMITEDGHVSAVAIESSEIASATMGKCLSTAVARWRFPTSEGASTAMVSYPFVFTNDEPARRKR
jgi:Ca-activated chloride channel family protein